VRTIEIGKILEPVNLMKGRLLKEPQAEVFLLQPTIHERHHHGDSLFLGQTAKAITECGKIQPLQNDMKATSDQVCPMAS
jgi:hypothetical protein